MTIETSYLFVLIAFGGVAYMCGFLEGARGPLPRREARALSLVRRTLARLTYEPSEAHGHVVARFRREGEKILKGEEEE